MVQVFYILDLEGMRGPNEFNWTKFYMASYMATKWIMFHAWSIGYCVKFIKKRVGLMQSIQGTRQSIELPSGLRNLTLSRWEPKPEHILWSINMAHIHFTLSFRAHQLFLFPMIWPSDNFKDPQFFHGRGSWYMYKAALTIILCNQVAHTNFLTFPHYFEFVFKLVTTNKTYFFIVIPMQINSQSYKVL